MEPRLREEIAGQARARLLAAQIAKLDKKVDWLQGILENQQARRLKDVIVGLEVEFQRGQNTDFPCNLLGVAAVENYGKATESERRGTPLAELP